MEEKTYLIGDKEFVQKKLVWGQAKQLIKEIEGVVLPPEFTPRDVIKLLEEKLPNLVAIVLIPKGQTARNKNMQEMIELFEWELSLEQMSEIIEDFFDCNPIPFWFEKLGNRIGAMSDLTKSSERETGLTETSSFSAEVTSQDETQ